jgi:hypothetical protein
MNEESAQLESIPPLIMQQKERYIFLKGIVLFVN